MVGQGKDQWKCKENQKKVFVVLECTGVQGGKYKEEEIQH